MTRNQRIYFLRTARLGLLVTLTVIAVDFAGWFQPLENYLYDKRIQYFQHFSPKPTTELVHLDIDDAALESVGRWPWPRSTMAQIIDELHLLHAKTLCLDIIMPEPDLTPAPIPSGGSGSVPTSSLPPSRVITNDTLLAQSINKFGPTLIPVSFIFNKTSPPLPAQFAAAARLQSDLTLTYDDLHAQLPDLTPNQYIFARRQAISARVEHEVALETLSADQLTARLLPTSAASDPALKNLIALELRLSQSRHAIERFGQRLSTPIQHLLEPSEELLPIPELARAASATGFVDHLPYGDGVVRSVPLFVYSRGRLYPQMGLALACLDLNVPIDRVLITESSVTIPRDNVPPIILPVHSYQSPRLAREVNLLMDVPWFGTSEWESMYGPNQHFPIVKVWEMTQDRQTAASNNRVVDKALKAMVELYHIDSPAKFLASAPDPAVIDSRLDVVRKSLDEIKQFVDIPALQKIPAAQRKPDESRLLEDYTDLQRILAENQTIQQRFQSLQDILHDKTILIGSISTGAFDHVTTPLGAQFPGVVVHGAVFNAIMTNNFWHRAPYWITALQILLIGLTATTIVAFLPPFKAFLASLALILGYLFLNGCVYFDFAKNIVGAAGPIVAGSLVWGGVTLSRYIIETRERMRITDRFRSYADEQLVDYVVEHPDQINFDGQEQELTVVFTDMQGFTTLMEKLGKKIVPILNEYMGRMVPVIQSHGGYVNKFLGDGIMFFYGAPRPTPDHASRAVATVLEMQQAVQTFNTWLTQQNLPPVNVRAGVTTGLMIVGDAGPRIRSDYTVLGDSVNLASRLESANKQLDTSILISQRTADLLNNHFLLRPIARIQVVGKSESVQVFEPLAPLNQATDSQKALASLTTEIVASFQSGHFQQCLTSIDAAIKITGPSKLFTLYHHASAQYLNTSPKDFDGRLSLSEK